MKTLTARNEVGLDHYQVRHDQAWYRHITLVTLAAAYLAVTRATKPEKGDPQTATTNIRKITKNARRQCTQRSNGVPFQVSASLIDW